MAPKPELSDRPRRARWIPLSLRMFMAVLAICSLSGTWWIVFRGYPRWAAVREIERRGGAVLMGSAAPTLVRRCVGNDWMKAVDTPDFVSASRTRFSDADMPLLDRLAEMTNLSLQNTQITDAALERMVHYPRLETLDLDSTAITDAGLQHLRGCSSLRRLSLVGTAVTDAGVESLERALPLLSVRQ